MVELPNRIIITGGCGFIGSNFIHHLLHSYSEVPAGSCCPDHTEYSCVESSKKIEVLNIDKMTYAANERNLGGVSGYEGYSLIKADISDSETIMEIFEDFKPQCVVHFAAESHVDRSIESGYEFILSNVLGTQVLLEASRKIGVEIFMHVSTDEVYGSIMDGSFTETDLLRPSSPYSSSKAASDLVALSYGHTYGTPVIVSRCTNNYGPRQHPEKLVPMVISNALSDAAIPVYGSGLQVRDWLYVKDHCEALIRLISDGVPGQVYNIAAQSKPTNLEMIDAILSHMGEKKHLISHVEDRMGHDFRYSIDDSKLRDLDWCPAVGFNKGVELTVDWYLNNLNHFSP